MKIRMKFSKTGPLMYVGHLDTLRYFQKVFRRSGVDIAYSNGFSPHQILSFAAPLGIGVTSEGEYLDTEFHSVTTSEDMLRQINAATLTPYIEVTKLVQLEEGAKKAMAAVAGADYRVTLVPEYEGQEAIAEAVPDYLEQKQIVITKKTKKGEKEVDLRPLIHQLQVREGALFMRLTTGSSDNLRPDTVMENLAAFAGVKYNSLSFLVHRLDTLLWKEQEEGGCFAPLSSAGHPIG